MKFEEYNRIIYVKDDSYNEKYKSTFSLFRHDENNLTYFKGFLVHREDGPAIEHKNGNKSWYKNGQFHREDGPACENINGNKCYLLNDKEYSEEEYWNIINITKKQEILNNICGM